MKKSVNCHSCKVKMVKNGGVYTCPSCYYWITEETIKQFEKAEKTISESEKEFWFGKKK